MSAEAFCCTNVSAGKPTEDFSYSNASAGRLTDDTCAAIAS